MASGSMATTTEIQQRVELDLRLIELTLADLPGIADEWGQIGEGERVSWSMDWSNEMSGLEHLARLATEGVLTDDQLARYREIVRTLAQALPIVERLDLYRPSIVRRT
jgi:hypothetical protein